MTAAPRRDCFLAAVHKGLVTEGVGRPAPRQLPVSSRRRSWRQAGSRVAFEVRRRGSASTLPLHSHHRPSSLSLLQNVKCGEIR